MKINEIAFLKNMFRPADDPMRHIGEVGSKAYKQLMSLLQQNKVDLRTVNSQQFSNMLRQWTEQYMAGGDSAQEKPYIISAIQRLHVPGLINNNSIRDYLLQAAEVRAQAKVNVAKQLPGIGPQQNTQVRASIAGLSLVRGQNDPDDEVILRYNGKDYTIDDSTGEWVNERGQPLNSKFQRTFYKEAGALAPNNLELIQGLQTYSNIPLPGAGPQQQQPASQQQQQSTQQQQPAPQQQAPLANTGVTVVQSSPLVLQYKKQDFALTNNGNWVNVMNGRPVNTALAQFLQAQADKL
jgi:hypothetical protein